MKEFKMIFRNSSFFPILQTLGVLLSLWVFLSCASVSPNPVMRSLRFPNLEGLSEKKSGAFLVETFSFRGADVDFGSILVPENRNKPESRLLHLPFLRYRSKSVAPLDPVFYLHGGPGLPNAEGNTFLAGLFQDAHDVVFVGYRGIDGKTNLLTLNLFNRMTEIMKKREPISPEDLKQLAQAFKQDCEAWKENGIDVEGYNTIDVVDDMEAVRSALGYEKINLFGQSYGSRLAYYYSLRYPKQVNRVVQQGISPPGGFYFEKDRLQKVFELYNKIWQLDDEATKLSPDLYTTWKNVLLRLPITVKGTEITREYLASMVHGALYNVSDAPMVFKLLLSAEKGDFTPLVDIMIQASKKGGTGGINADSLLKIATSDYDPAIDYLADFLEKHPGTISYATLPWATLSEDPTWIKTIPQEYRTWSNTDVQTLLINGTLDPSTPSWDLEEYASHYKNGKLILVRERSHSDIYSAAPSVWKELFLTYFRTGKFDETQVPYIKAKLY